MKFSTLHTFKTIVETGSLVRASQKLNLTQSTVTARLQQLEDEFGQTLLIRQKSGIKLTASGYKLLRHGEVMLSLWQQTKQDLTLPDGINILCNIGCHMDLWSQLASPLLKQIQHSHKQTALTLWPGDQAALERWFGAGLSDIIFAYQATTQNNQTIRALPSENLALYSTTANSPIRFDPTYVYVDYGEHFRQQHAKEYADAAIAQIQFGCAIWALDHLLENGGSAYLPEKLAKPACDKGLLHPLTEGPIFSRNVYLISNDEAMKNWPWLINMILSIAEESCEP